MRCGLCRAPSDRPTSAEALGLAVEELERAWMFAEFGQPEPRGYEPLRADQFLEALTLAMTLAQGDRFLEVGCGIGTKLLLASTLGLDVTGIEIREHLVVLARRLCPTAAVLVADALAYDYSGADIIYSYRPFYEPDLQARLDEAVARTSAVVVAPWSDLAEYGRRPHGPHRFVWTT